MSKHTFRSLSHLGQLFIIEGPDGIGKSTIANLVNNQLKDQGIQTLVLSFPGREDHTLGNLVYRIYHNLHDLGIRKISQASLQTMHIAAHIDCIEARILPALMKGVLVILDRFWWSTVAYGQVNGVTKKSLDTMIVLEASVWGNVHPACAYLLACNKPYRSELPLDDWQVLTKKYHSIAKQQKLFHDVLIVDNNGKPERTVQIVYNHIRKFSDLTSASEVADKR